MQLAFRSIASLTVLVLAAGCQGTPTPKPMALGDYHVSGASSALFQSTDGGDFGDTKQFAMNASAGKFIADKLLLEGLVIVSQTNAEADNGDDTDTTIAALGAGVRYYTDTVSTQRPYFGGGVGFAHVSIDDDATGIDDSDTAPFFQVYGGLETFLSNTVALDLSVFLRDVIDVEIENADDDLTTFGLAAGISIWF